VQKQYEMMVGIGIDIIEVERVANSISKDNGFREKVFSKGEIEFCESKGISKAQHYAARFCAKEAFLKATGKGLLLSNELNEIEVTITEEGKPEIRLTGNLALQTEKEKWKVHLSLSHIHSTACATVVIETIP
jgi:holo-[acyl-carrier protein] synthase